MPHIDTHRLLIARGVLHRTAWAPDPDATRPLEPGQARLAVEQVALTANNITYAAFGEAMKYWQFFPAPEPGFGCLPTWGFATVAESRAEGLAVGRRVWGYLPLGTHLVVQPARVRTGGFMDQSPHRAGLAAAYQSYGFCDADPAWRPELEGLQAVLKPLFMTAFLLDDFLAEAGFFGGRRLLLSSASSKTAFATAFCLARRPPGARPAIVGLTSDARVGFVQGLGCYDEVLAYGALESLPADEPAVYVDFAGDAGLRRRVHQHWGDRLGFSSSIGGTHWRDLGSGGGLPGPRPTLFFAPAQAARRSGPPPEGWGAEAFGQRLGEGWQALLAAVQRGPEPWVRIVQRQGPAAAEAAYRALVDGTADAREGVMIDLR
ncbi:MAG: DUF2855 family protein [Burkholderiaceae bacterium]|jgi:hypothetical protein|nr:DUF2855 family protein [Burkholderiaceae bacterium]MCZ8177089.1 DUF2855 family protein [Burkholderiaceae bacterium]